MKETKPFNERIQQMLVKYEKVMQKNGVSTTATNWIALAFGSAIILSVLGFLVFSLVGLDHPLLITVVVFFVVIDLVLGYPLSLDMQRINRIEEAFPNVLKQLGDTLKAGGTYEFALREVSDSDYGPLTKELKLVLRRLEEGQNLDKSLQLMQEEIDSRLVKRTLTIIIDALKSGGGLAEILDEIADDMRDLHRIQLERRTKTTMQVLFLVTAGAIVGPAIMGFTTTVLEFLITTAVKSQAIQPDVIEQSLQSKQIIIFLLTSYIIIEAIAASILLGLMRDGQAKKSIIYIPVLLFMGLFLFYGARIITKVILHF
ncbi:MAG: type II secretion system F family protein [Candidatus Diapherotrites archaeon]|uniref:Type II secretion system F family protein n=1 Tax=Candidatus Iainarchaeum sp. TaxID=3101447 RepID=A0A8T4LCY3_9ARCH|nr:type II secretion system F family protein [Candidatus Diapherotrites archaeon]